MTSKRRIAALLLMVGLTACTPEEMIRKAFEMRGATKEQQDNAVAIGTCESGLRPDARNGSNRGLMQINVGSTAQGPRVARLGLGHDDMYNPWWNAVVAADLWSDLGRFGSTVGWGNCARVNGIY